MKPPVYNARGELMICTGTINRKEMWFSVPQIESQCRKWMEGFDRAGRKHKDHWANDPSYFWAKKTRRNPLR